jgi:hypothetical protein
MTTKRQDAAPAPAPPRRGRPPRRVYINVLVKATTREGLTRLKADGALASQGEVIDGLVAQALAQRPRRGS